MSGFLVMPTDGADFQRMKGCYGKAYSSARDGASARQVATYVVRGIERDIRREGGLPAFRRVVEVLLTASSTLAVGDAMTKVKIEFAASSLTRELAAAAERVSATFPQGSLGSPEAAAHKLLMELSRGRACDGMIGYLVRNTGLPVDVCVRRVDEVVADVGQAAELRDLSVRMLTGSTRGIPAKAPKSAAVCYEPSALHAYVIGGFES